MSQLADAVRCAREQWYKRGYADGVHAATKHGHWISGVAENHTCADYRCSECGGMPSNPESTLNTMSN